MDNRTEQEDTGIFTGRIESTGYQPDPLESAIESTVRMLNETDDRSQVHERLTGHLEQLLVAQMARVSE